LIEKVKSLMINYGVNENLAPFLSNIITLTAVMVISLTAASVVRKILFRVLESYAEKSKANWHTVFTERRIFDRLVRIIPIGIIHAFAPLFPPYTEWIPYYTHRNYTRICSIISSIYRMDPANRLFQHDFFSPISR